MAVLVNAAILYAVNMWPGWQALPFLTADVSLVLGVDGLTVSTAADAFMSRSWRQ